MVVINYHVYTHMRVYMYTRMCVESSHFVLVSENREWLVAKHFKCCGDTYLDVHSMRKECYVDLSTCVMCRVAP